jgi:hypothetical protein
MKKLILLTMLMVLCVRIQSAISQNSINPCTNPNELIERLVRSMSSNDSKLFVSCFCGTADQMKYVLGLADFISATHTFKEKFIHAYGEDGWRDFQNPEKAPKGPSSSWQADWSFKEVSPHDIVSTIQGTHVHVDGELAYFSLPNENVEVMAIRKNSMWCVAAETFLPPGADINLATEYMDKMTSMVRRFETVIGMGNISVEDIDYEMGRASAEMMGVHISDKHRFDIGTILSK